MRTRVGLLCAALVLAVAGPAAAAPKWQAFGNAAAVKLGPGAWAVELTSDWTGFLPEMDWSSPDLYGGIAYEPKKGTTFADLHTLSTDFNGSYAGGSPRFQINVQTPTGVRNVFVYLGAGPNFVGQTDGWENSGNLIEATDLRFDLTQIGGPFYGSYADALAAAGDLPVVGIQLVVDGGWVDPLFAGVQTVLVDNVRVNNDVLKAKGFQK